MRKIIGVSFVIFCLGILFSSSIALAQPQGARPDKPMLYKKQDYSAKLSILEKKDSAQSITFTIEAQNTGNKTWEPFNEVEFKDATKRKYSDSIRVGCRIAEGLNVDGPFITELRQELPMPIAKGNKTKVTFNINKNQFKKGKEYFFKFDMVNEAKFWFGDLGGTPKAEYIQM